MGQGLETLTVEEPQTVAELLADKGLSANNFFVTKNVSGQSECQLLMPTDKLEAGQEIKIIPKVAGGY